MYYQSSRKRVNAINDAIFNGLKCIYRLRRIQLHVTKEQCINSYVVTIAKSRDVTAEENTLRFFEIIKSTLTAGERLICEHGCFAVIGDGYKIYYCLEGFKKNAENLYYVENGQAVKQPLGRISTEAVAARARRLGHSSYPYFYYNEFDLYAKLKGKMNEPDNVESFPNPADRFGHLAMLYCDTVATETLYRRLTEQPFNAQSIKEFITYNKLSKRVITDAALRMCIMGEYSYDNFISTYSREPAEGELFTHDWEERFSAVTECGVDPEMTFDDDRYSDCIYESLEYIDDGDLAARMLCRLLEKCGLPKRLTVDGVPYFDEIDSTFITDISLGVYDDNKEMYDRNFRYWAVFIGYGAARTDGNEVITMQNGYDVSIMKKYDLLDFEELRSSDKLELHIFRKDNGESVATTLIWQKTDT